MDLWIRSQDRECLIKIENVYIDKRDFGNDDIQYYISTGTLTKLGTYKSKERALEVLDEIQERLINLQLVSLEEKGKARKDVYTRPYLECVYEMPKENKYD